MDGHVYMYVYNGIWDFSQKKKKKWERQFFFFFLNITLAFAHLISFPGTPPGVFYSKGVGSVLSASAELTGL